MRDATLCGEFTHGQAPYVFCKIAALRPTSILLRLFLGRKVLCWKTNDKQMVQDDSSLESACHPADETRLVFDYAPDELIISWGHVEERSVGERSRGTARKSLRCLKCLHQYGEMPHGPTSCLICWIVAC